MPKLNQIIAVEKGVKSRVYGEITDMHKSSQKPDLFNGFVKSYRRKDEDGEDYPAERKKVQMMADVMLARAATLLAELFDVTATKDWGNCHAFADVEVDGQVLVKNAPVPYLLFLEKQINDLHAFVDKLPVLDETDDWTKDDNAGLYKTMPIPTHRTKKVQKPVVLYEATKEHPAQTQIITEDVVVGYWDTVKHSGALPAPRRQVLLERIERLSKAVKFAREKANDAETENQKIGKAIFDYLLS
ncbi:MAG TPA: hypothetical protein VFD58_04565 [Blastocatellia bacterium]|nr:hypothetical protein [Blastocatellia bacterium]